MSDIASEKDENWTLVVKPRTGWFDLHLNDLWRYRDLVMMFVRRDFIALYKQTILGPLWFIIQPLITTFMFLFVFGGIAHIPTDGIPGILFYLSGLTVWNYFATCFNKTSATFVNNAVLFGKVYFPRLVTPVSIIVSGLITFFIQFLLFISFLLYYIFFKGQVFHFSAYLLLIPYLVVVMGALGLGLGIIVSSLTTKYRDLTYLVSFGVQLLMYFSPVIIPLSIVLGKKRLLFAANPMTSIIEGFRYAFFPQGHFHWPYLVYSSVFTLVILCIGVLIFNKTEKSFTDTV